MLIRFVVRNVLSFAEEREFNMLPSSSRGSKLDHHKYTVNDIDLLKMTAMYGANGAGKSNMIKAMDYLVEMVTEGNVHPSLHHERNKFLEDGETQLLGIEFIAGNKTFTYAVEILDGIILTEELSYQEKKSDEPTLILNRYFEGNKVKFKVKTEDEDISDEDKFSQFFIGSFLKSNALLLPLIATNTEETTLLHTAYSWFTKNIQFIYTDSIVYNTARRINEDIQFKNFLESIIGLFNTGITKINVETKPILEYFGANETGRVNSLIQEIDKDKDVYYENVINSKSESVLLTKEEDQYVAKYLQFVHKLQNGKEAIFNLTDESDGTIRLFNLISLFYDVIYKNQIRIIDEIENSLHPSILRKLISKFSELHDTKGQLVFSTHECMILDQNLLRQDEIWFVEKDANGSTDLYPLSDFKEHHTKNIRNGYLNGRYGAIPFLGDLDKLNWTADATIK